MQSAKRTRDAISKKIYTNLREHIITSINSTINGDQRSRYYLGLLDMPGFGELSELESLFSCVIFHRLTWFNCFLECFQLNSLEQLLINFANEKIQQYCIEKLITKMNATNSNNLKKSSDILTLFPNIERVLSEYILFQLYTTYLIVYLKMNYFKLFLGLIANKENGIFALLNDESKLNSPSAQKFTLKVHSSWKSFSGLTMPQKKDLGEGFTIRHFAGDVYYNTVIRKFTVIRNIL